MSAKTGKRLGKRRVVRAGRPPRELAGEVDDRIMDAAHRIFLERGLGAASMDEIARVARAGKPTIYARFPSKEALFTAVVMRDIAGDITRLESHVPTGATVEERLASVGVASLQWVLVSDTIGLLQLVIAEAGRFPDLARTVDLQTRARGSAAVGRLLRAVAQSDELGALPAFAPERLTLTTRFFLDLVLMPLVMRALLGEDLKSLRAEIETHVARGVAFFLAACRHGGITE